MNRAILIAMFFLLNLMLSRCHKQDISNPLNKIIASYTESNMIIDGLLTEAIWQKSQTVTLRKNKTGESLTDTIYSTFIKTAYDKDNLFIAFVCNDPDIWGDFTDRDKHLWTEEAVEVFIDTDTISNTYVEIEVSPNNVIFDSYIVDPFDIDISATKEFDLNGMKTAVLLIGSVNNNNDTDKKWTVEMSIPLKELVDENYSVIPDKTEWRINFYRIERERTGESISYAWSPTWGRFHRPDKFGILGFGLKN